MMWDWLTASLDATRGHEITFAQAWHGRFMVLAWGICAPLGILIARYLKVTPRQRWPEELDNKFWWHAHLFFQITASVSMGVGFLIILFSRGEISPSNLHAWFGWCVVIGTIVQVLSGVLRGTKGGPLEPLPDGSLMGDHYAMTFRRRVFERVHKSLGYLLLLGASCVILQGLWILNAPKWMVLSLLDFWVVLAAVLRMSRRRPSVATYQAIWGIDPRHPGNQK
jgi:hypothetical protein